MCLPFAILPRWPNSLLMPCGNAKAQIWWTKDGPSILVTASPPSLTWKIGRLLLVPACTYSFAARWIPWQQMKKWSNSKIPNLSTETKAWFLFQCLWLYKQFRSSYLPRHHQFLLSFSKETPFWSTVGNLDMIFFCCCSNKSVENQGRT